MARCEAPPSPAFPLPPILKGLRAFFGVVTDWEDWEGGIDSLVGRMSVSGSTVSDSTPVLTANGGGDSVVFVELPPIRKLFTLAFWTEGVNVLGEEWY
jgi:hypothetical protein